VRWPGELALETSLETIVWANWAIILSYGLYSKQCIGVGAFVLFGGLILIHILERKVITEASWASLFSPRSGTEPLSGVLVTAGGEAIAGTAFWALVINGHPVIGTVVLFGFLFLEHTARREQLHASH
jgi:hypothetical protein